MVSSWLRHCLHASGSPLAINRSTKQGPAGVGCGNVQQCGNLHKAHTDGHGLQEELLQLQQQQLPQHV